jgi:hypothetical protein
VQSVIVHRDKVNAFDLETASLVTARNVDGIDFWIFTR